ncbi:MAG: hypothetical protein KY457_12820 [Actinobacteria bacterium]|nr:hypothetical protein [Actinomycetota bacterium]
MSPRSSLILDTVLETIFRTAVVFSLFLLFAGHNSPGGGFVGGLVTAAALVLRYVAGGTPRIDSVARVAPRHLLGGGLFLAGLTGVGGWLWGDVFLKSVKVDLVVPLLGEIHATSALPFDIGVYLVVVGLGLVILRSLGAEAER